jgi:hypothetical protein
LGGKFLQNSGYFGALPGEFFRYHRLLSYDNPVILETKMPRNDSGMLEWSRRLNTVFVTFGIGLVGFS